MSEVDNEANLWESRLARIRTEVIDEGVAFTSGVGWDIALEEILYSRMIKVHEGIRPPYGALICRFADLSKIDADSVSAPGDAQALRPFADGSSAVILRDIDNPSVGRLLQIDLADEFAALKLARTTKGMLVQRHESGTITAVSEHQVLINELFTWRRRPVANDWVFEAQDYFALAGGVVVQLFTRILDFAFHQLSPRNIGATIVLRLGGPPGYEDLALDSAGSAAPLKISFLKENDAQIMATFLRIVDGACLVGADGILMRTQAKLSSNKKTSALLGADRGMRHSSAKWFSYDHPDVVVFVVSADGPVSIYSDGVKVDLQTRHEEKQPTARNIQREQVPGLSLGENTVHCGGCNRDVGVKSSIHSDGKATTEVKCPICGRFLVESSGFWARATPLKPWSSNSSPKVNS